MSWKCPTCTYAANAALAPTCQMCKAPNPNLSGAPSSAPGWKCSMCTFANNSPQSTMCQTCHAPKQGALPAPAQGTWACKICSFATNDAVAPICSMCRQPRQQGSAPDTKRGGVESKGAQSAEGKLFSVKVNKFSQNVTAESWGADGDDIEDEKQFDIKDDASIPFTTYYDVLEEFPECAHLLKKIPSSKTLVSAIKELDSGLMAESGRSLACCCNTTVLQGELGVATKYGETYFFPPGNYWWLGIGVDFAGTIQIEDDKHAGNTVVWKDITYVNVAECNCAVVQVDRKQLILGPGRYILRDPAQLCGRVNIQNLKNKLTIIQKTEVPGVLMPGQNPRDLEDRLEDVRLAAGESEICGAVTFVRANPGFCYIVQNVLGQLRTGIGMTICRGGEIFLKFVDRQNYSRTTRTFYLESKDRQEVRVRVQLKWRLENAKLWISRKGASENIFDAIEEIAQSLMRDAIASHTYEEASLAASKGFDSMEAVVADPLRMECHNLGGRLIGFEIRSLRFPLLERRNQARAEQETVMSEAILEQRRKLELEAAAYLREDANLLYAQREQKSKIIHETKMQVLRDEEELARMEARSQLEVARQAFDIQKQVLTLEAAQTQQILVLQQAEEKARSGIKTKLIHAKGHADKAITLASADAEQVRMESTAQAEAKIEMAEADAKAADHIGSAYQNNGPYLNLTLATMNADLQEERATEVALAMEGRGGEFIMLPVDLQDEMTEISVVPV